MANQSNTFHGANVFGGFNVQGNQFHGNVNIGGTYRDDTNGLEYLRHLKTFNPEDERRRILTVKDQLVAESYSWILENETFRSWHDGDTNHLLWIKGGPGKGKTMMMAGLVDVLSEERNPGGAIALSYFFCRNSDTGLRNAVSIVKGLIYMLAFQERSLVYHLKKKYEADGEEAFTGPRALFTLWNILENMLKDFHGARVYLLVDGLDECDDPEFDDFLRLLSSYNVTIPGKVKWLVTSRPFPRIEDLIGPDQDRYRISLEIEAHHVSQGVETFINEKVKHLKKKRHWSAITTQKVHSYLQNNAEGTFLWVDLVCKRLQQFPAWTVEGELTKLSSLQRGLDSFYDRMMQVVRDEIPEYAELCTNILRTTTLAYRPFRLHELGTVVALPHELQSDDSPNFDALRDLIERCGSFILIHGDTIYFVHQSAKDYLSGESSSTNFTLDRSQENTSIAEKCLDTLNSCLKDHHFPDPTSLNKQELDEDELRLLSRIAYACSYWIHHTLESVAQNSYDGSVPNQEKICDLFDSHLIAWVHALGSLKEVTPCVRMIKRFLDTQYFEGTNLFHMIQDTYRFLRQNRHIIEESPNQAYTSALLFVPKSSWIRKVYQNRIPKWITLRTQLADTWDACLVTLLGHSKGVKFVTFSSDGSILATKSDDCTRLWETETGKCRGILSHDEKNERLSFCPEDFAFSPDGRVLATRSCYNIVLLDTTTGSQQSVLTGHTSSVKQCLFAPNSQILASSDQITDVRLWDISTGSACGSFKFEWEQWPLMDFSNDSKHVVIPSGSEIQVLDVETSNIVATFREHNDSHINSVQFSPDSHLVLSVSESSIWLWSHTTTEPGRELEIAFHSANSAKFSPDGSLIVSIHDDIIDTNVTLWETSTGNKLHVLPFPVPVPELPERYQPMFSPDSRVIVTPLINGAKSWDTTTGGEIATFEASQTNEDAHWKNPYISIISRDGKLFAQSMDSEIRVWEVATGVLLRTLQGHSGNVSDLEFSPVGGLIASASDDRTVKLWSLSKGPSTQAITRTGIAPIQRISISLDGTLAAACDLSFGKPVAISPDNSLLAVSALSHVLIWETKNGSLRYESTGSGNGGFSGVEFSPDSRLLKVKCYDGSIQLVENHAREFEEVQKPSHAKSPQSQKSPDGRFFIGLGPSFRSACLWEQQKDAGQAILKFELGGVCGVATFSPDSKLVAFVSDESFICVWETETGVCLGVHAKTSSCTGPVSFSHDGRFIAHTLGDEKRLGLFVLSKGFSRKMDVVCEDPVNLVTFSPDASVVAATSDCAFLLCETKSGSVARKLEYDQKGVSDIIFLPDWDILIAGHEDGTIRSWDTKNDTLLHTISGKDYPPLFSLDSKRKFLWTGNQGFFLDEVLQPCEKSPVSVKDNWVLFNGERVFLLPTQFAPTHRHTWSASSRGLVVGHKHGNFTFLHFDI